MNLEMLSALVGSGLPMLVALVNQAHWPSWVKAVVAVLASIAAGAVTAAVSGQFTGTTWTEAALIVAGAAFTSWKVFWHPSGIGPAIEKATTPGA